MEGLPCARGQSCVRFVSLPFRGPPLYSEEPPRCVEGLPSAQGVSCVRFVSLQFRGPPLYSEGLSLCMENLPCIRGLLRMFSSSSVQGPPLYTNALLCTWRASHVHGGLLARQNIVDPQRTFFCMKMPFLHGSLVTSFPSPPRTCRCGYWFSSC